MILFVSYHSAFLFFEQSLLDAPECTRELAQLVLLVYSLLPSTQKLTGFFVFSLFCRRVTGGFMQLKIHIHSIGEERFISSFPI